MIQTFITRAELNHLLTELDAGIETPQLVKVAMMNLVPNEEIETVYISRRNILTLLSKLDRAQRGEKTACTILKNDTAHLKYPCTSRFAITATEEPVPVADSAFIFALEDEEYYVDRPAGPIHPADLGALA